MCGSAREKERRFDGIMPKKVDSRSAPKLL